MKKSNNHPVTNNATDKKVKKGNPKMNAKPTKELTAEQKKQLEALNERILGSLTKNYELGKALIEVKALLKGTVEKFEPYCKEHFNLAHSQVNRLMHYATTRDNIGMGDEEVYIPENTLRGLDRYPAETQMAIWEEAKKLAGEKDIPTAANVADARKKIAPKEEPKQDLKKKFHSRALNADVDLEKEKPVDVIRKADSVAKIKSVINEVVLRVELTSEERKKICEFIKTKAAEEAMALMAPKSATGKSENKGVEKVA